MKTQLLDNSFVHETQCNRCRMFRWKRGISTLFYLATIMFISVLLMPMDTAAGFVQPIYYSVKSPPTPPEFPGSRDPGFNSAFASAIVAAAVQPDGKMIVAYSKKEEFEEEGYRYRLARLNSDGSLDASWSAEINIESWIYHPTVTIVLQSDGRILLTGKFISINGSSSSIVRLDPAGKLDETFHSPFAFSFTVDDSGGYDNPWSAALQFDKKILIAGGFTNVGGLKRPGIVRLNSDGSLDLTFAPDSLLPARGEGIMSFGIQSDQKVLIGTSYGIYRLNSDGSLDPFFGDGSGVQGRGIGDYVGTLALQPDGKFLAGFFGLARFHSDGTRDSTFIAGHQDRVDISSFISAIALQLNGKILIAGKGGGVARLNPDGELDPGFDLAAGLIEREVSMGTRAISIQPDGKVLIVGAFSDWLSFVNSTVIPRQPTATLVRVHGGEHPAILPRSVRRLDGQIQFQATGPQDRMWTVQAATNLSSGPWVAIATNTVGTAASTITDPAPATVRHRFYRAVLAE